MSVTSILCDSTLNTKSLVELYKIAFDETEDRCIRLEAIIIADRRCHPTMKLLVLEQANISFKFIKKWFDEEIEKLRRNGNKTEELEREYYYTVTRSRMHKEILQTNRKLVEELALCSKDVLDDFAGLSTLDAVPDDIRIVARAILSCNPCIRFTRGSDLDEILLTTTNYFNHRDGFERRRFDVYYISDLDIFVKIFREFNNIPEISVSDGKRALMEVRYWCEGDSYYYEYTRCINNMNKNEIPVNRNIDGLLNEKEMLSVNKTWDYLAIMQIKSYFSDDSSDDSNSDSSE